MHDAATHLDAHTLLDSDTLELVFDGFALLFGLGDLFVCFVGFCSPFQLVSFLACRKRSWSGLLNPINPQAYLQPSGADSKKDSRSRI